MTKPRKRVLNTTHLWRNLDRKHGGRRQGAGRPNKLNARARSEIGRLFDDLWQQAVEAEKKKAEANWKSSELGEVPAIWTELQALHSKELQLGGVARFKKMNPKWSDTLDVSELLDEMKEARRSADVSRFYRIYFRIPRGTTQGIAKEVQRTIIDQGGPRVPISTIKRIWREYCLYTEDAEI